MAACLADSEPSSARPTIRATAVTVPMPRIEVRTTSRLAETRIGGDQAFEFRVELAIDVSRRGAGA